MAADRRTFSLGLLAALTTTACSFGSPSQARQPAGWWAVYRDRFLLPEGRIADSGNGNVSHSEGQGYGMVLAAAAGDGEAFARMARWTQGNLARRDMALHSWRYDPRQPVPVGDPNNATDGDILIAWALGLGAKRWRNPGYAARAAAIRAAIRQHCVTERFGRQILLPGIEGFAQGAHVTFNPSYIVWPALDAFAQADGPAAWRKLIADSEDLVRLCRFGPHALPCDWAVVSGLAEVAPAPGKPPRFGFDAVRVPLYAAIGRRAALAQPVAAFWQERRASRRPIPAWIDVVTGEEAPYALSEGGMAAAALLAGSPPPAQLSADYYAASLQLLAALPRKGGRA